MLIDIIGVSCLWLINTIVVALIFIYLRKKSKDKYNRKDYLPIIIFLCIWEVFLTFLACAVILQNIPIRSVDKQ